MSWPWRSAQATRQALSEHIEQRFAPEQRAQRLREIAYRRLLARLFETQPTVRVEPCARRACRRGASGMLLTAVR